MKLIIIYGSEAVGKLTIAKEVVRKTGYKLFHNHVSVDVARSLFDFGEDGWDELIWGVRDLVFDCAGKWDVPGMIFTWAYSHPDFQPYLDRIRSVINKHDGEIHFVYVWCSEEELKKRVVQEGRQAVGKITTVEALERQRERKNHQAIPGSASLEIDNTHLSPEEAADRIINHFKLRVVEGH